MPATETTPARPLPTIWELPDDLWKEIEPIINCFYPLAGTGRPRADLRRVLDGIIHRLRSGCQWRHLPERFGATSTVHGWFQRFSADGLLEELWAYLVRECEELGGVRWEWQAVDGVMGKSRFSGGARGPNPTDRAKMGTKKSVLVEQDGGPLSTVIDGANVHDTKLLERTIDAIVVPRPDPKDLPQNLCLWTRGMTTRPARPPAPPQATSRTSAASARRSSTPGVRRPTPPADGSSSAPSLGYRSAAHSWSATTRSPPTTSGSSNSPARSSGTGAATAYFTPDEFSDSF